MDHPSLKCNCRCGSNGPMEGRRGHAGRRAIGRRDDAKMCVLAVIENRKTFGRRRRRRRHRQRRPRLIIGSRCYLDCWHDVLHLLDFRRKLDRGITQPVSPPEEPLEERRRMRTPRTTTRTRANKNRWRARSGAAGSVRYFDVNNFGSALDHFWREKEQGREGGRVR